MNHRNSVSHNSLKTSPHAGLRLIQILVSALAVGAVCLMCAPGPASFAGSQKPSTTKIASRTDADTIVADAFPVSIPYALKKPGKVSVAVYDKDGRLLRTLKRAQPEAAGSHTIQWDGLDREGRPASPGKYTWKLLRTDGLRSELLAQVGINPGPFWEIGVGNHSAASVLAADGDGFFLFPPVAEGGFKAAKIRPDRSYLWGTVNYTFNYLRSGAAPRLKFQHKIRWGYRAVAAAAAENRVYILSRNGNVYMLDGKTGRKRGKPFSVKWPEDPKMVPAQTMDMDADAKHLVVSYREHDAVRWYDPESGELRRTVKKIKSPLGVAVRPDDTALVITDGAVKSVGPKTGQPEIAIPARLLKSPWRLDVAPSTKEIFVAENSLAAGHKAAQHRVKRFSPEGKVLGRFGETQGRQDGPYRPHNFWNISDIVCDETGGFVVAEPNCPPRRVARFSRKGELVTEFFGALPYGTGCTPEPDNPRIVWYGTGSGAVRAEVDFENRSWRVLETYFHTLRQNELVGGFSGTKIYRARGRTYIATFKKSNSLLLYDPKAKNLRPVYTLGHQYLDYKGWVVPERFRDDKPKFRIRTGYAWCDEDADGRAVREELRLFNAWRAGGPGGRILHVGEDLTLYYANGKRLTPTSISEAGVPLYAPENTETFLNGYFRGLFQDAEGHWYSTRSGKLHGETHGVYWYPGTKGTDRLIKYNRDFNRQWAVGRHNARWDHEPGWSHSLIGVAGVTHGCVVADGNFVDTELVGPMVWTEDGLFVDELCVHPAGNLPEWIYRGSKLENPRGTVVDDPETGEALFYAHGNSAAPIWRIHGWDGWDRQEGTIHVTDPPPHAAAEGRGLQARYFANPDWDGEPPVARTDKRVYFNWKKKAPAEGVPKRGFSAEWTGSVEAPLTEVFAFIVRTGSRQGSKKKPAVRLWIDGTLICDSTTGLGVDPRNYRREHWKVHVPLQAGERYNLKLAYGERGSRKNFCHLLWESPSRERQSIASKYLYPEPADPRHVDPLPCSWSFGKERNRGQKRGGLIVHLPFNEKNGLVARSRVGPGLYGTLHGKTDWVEGIQEGALEVRGGLCSVVPALRMPHTNYTVSFWFRTRATDGRLVSVNRKPTFHNNFQDSTIALEDGNVTVQLAREKKKTAGKLNDGKWHHVALVVAAEEGFTLYIDGKKQLAGDTDRMGTWHLWHVPTERLGMRIGPADRKSTVTIDELRVFNRPLNRTELESVFKN